MTAWIGAGNIDVYGALLILSIAVLWVGCTVGYALCKAAARPAPRRPRDGGAW